MLLLCSGVDEWILMKPLKPVVSRRTNITTVKKDPLKSCVEDIPHGSIDTDTGDVASSRVTASPLTSLGNNCWLSKERKGKKSSRVFAMVGFQFVTERASPGS